MRSILTLFMAVAFLLLSGCSEPKNTDAIHLPTVGTRAIIKQYSYEIIAEVTNVQDNLVKLDYFWHGEKAYSQKFYKGLLPVWSEEDGNIKELDFQESKVDEIFPLVTGNEVSFTATMTRLDDGLSQNISVTLSVLKETVMTITGEDHKVFMIDIARIGENDYSSYETIYYAPDSGMILKAVKRERNSQTFWRILKLEKPENDDRSTIRKRQRRSGTIAI
ncbi:hypothetical protein QGN29_04965 [Temperatibacter marinus]|uniref:Uncharacterized protein n=1 Tax=Temperatibacter marinus TaxID=1456591 RepID=A0AA52HA01_9PROT|nr:hypothetical protein [Temperatibacter marinus]WND03726.1 hypothetical protein QGN29_04965 [Temperatibacter marinus]